MEHNKSHTTAMLATTEQKRQSKMKKLKQVFHLIAGAVIVVAFSLFFPICIIRCYSLSLSMCTINFCTNDAQSNEKENKHNLICVRACVCAVVLLCMNQQCENVFCSLCDMLQWSISYSFGISIYGHRPGE